MRNGIRRAIGVCACWFGVMNVALSSPAVLAQIPGLPTPAAPAKSAGGASSSATAEKPKAAVAATEGPITVHQQVSDKALDHFLARFLPKYPGVRDITVTVDDGVVTLTGQVDDDDTLDEITDVVKRVEGVRLVMNRMDTDDKVMSASEFAARELGAIGSYFKKNWLLMILAVVFVALSALIARVFAARSETILAPFVRNVLLRSVAGSVISTLVVMGGIMLALGGAAAYPPGALDRGRGVDRGSGSRLRISRYHRELHRLGALGCAPAVPDRRLHHRRRPDGSGQVAEYASDRSRNARRQSCADS